MKEPKNLFPTFAELRRQAEKQVQTIHPGALSPEECSRLFSSLQVHQIELEMQNEELRRAQDQLAESRNKYADLYDFAPVGYLSLDTRGKIVECNLTAASLLGVERGRLVGSFFPHYLESSDRRRLHQLLQGPPDQLEQRLEVQIATGGVDRIMLLNMFLIGDTQERRQCRVSLTDITELKRTQEELRRHKEGLEELVTARTKELVQVNEQLRETKDNLETDIILRKQAEAALQTRSRVLASMAEGVVVTDGQGHIVYSNQAFDNMFGYEPGELLSQHTNILNAYPPEENLVLVKEILRQINTSGAWHGECHNRKKDGTTFITAVRISALKINEEQLYISVQEDITTRKALEREMARLASFPQLNPNPVLEIDVSGRVTYCNPAGLQALAVLSVPGEPWRFLPPDWKNLLQAGRKSQDKQLYREVEINGEVFAETISFVPETEAMRLYAWNITIQQQALEALKQSEERYRSLFQNNHAVMLIIDPDTGDIIDANPAACVYYGFSHEDLTAIKIFEINGLTKDQTFAIMAQARAEERRQFFFRHRLAGGEIRDVEVFSGPIVTGGKKLLYSIVHDITERRQAEEALRRAHDELERRVLARTEELRHTVDKLLQEIADRKRAEENLKKSEEKLRLLTTQLLAAQEDERKRLAAELHDELGHALLTLKLHLSSIERQLLPEQVDLKEKMRDMVEYLQDTVEEVRRLYHNLSPGDLEDLGLSAALRTMVVDFQELYEDIDWNVELADIDNLFPLPIQIMVYRIVQEALTNIGKHAYPEHVKIKVTKENRQAVFVVEDDGRGFSMDEVLEGDRGGMGLGAMAQRVSLAGGSFDLWSRDNQGVRIIFSIPGAPVGERE